MQRARAAAAAAAAAAASAWLAACCPRHSCRRSRFTPLCLTCTRCRRPGWRTGVRVAARQVRCGGRAAGLSLSLSPSLCRMHAPSLPADTCTRCVSPHTLTHSLTHTHTHAPGASGGDLGLHLPEPNPFVPEDLSLVPPDQLAPGHTKEGLPGVLVDSGGLRLWQRTDLRFESPKATFVFDLQVRALLRACASGCCVRWCCCVRLQGGRQERMVHMPVVTLCTTPGARASLLHHRTAPVTITHTHPCTHTQSPAAYASPESAVCVRLLVKLMCDYLNELTYPAELAGLSYSISNHLAGLQVRAARCVMPRGVFACVCLAAANPQCAWRHGGSRVASALSLCTGLQHVHAHTPTHTHVPAHTHTCICVHPHRRSPFKVTARSCRCCWTCCWTAWPRSQSTPSALQVRAWRVCVCVFACRGLCGC
jgi:hypothetical protein